MNSELGIILLTGLSIDKEISHADYGTSIKFPVGWLQFQLPVMIKGKEMRLNESLKIRIILC